MSEPKHKLKRFVLELEVSKQQDAKHLQHVAANLLHHQLKTQLERVFSQYSPANTLHRIDRLELNLGVISKSQFDTDFPEQFMQELTGCIEQTIKQLEEEGGSQQDVYHARQELLSCYLTTGALPWWAENHREIVQETLLQLAADDRNSTQKLLRAVLQDNIQCFRLLYQLHSTQAVQAVLHAIFSFSEPVASAAARTAHDYQPAIEYTQHVQERLNLTSKKQKANFWAEAMRCADLCTSPLSYFVLLFGALKNEKQLGGAASGHALQTIVRNPAGFDAVSSIVIKAAQLVFQAETSAKYHEKTGDKAGELDKPRHDAAMQRIELASEAMLKRIQSYLSAMVQHCKQQLAFWTAYLRLMEALLADEQGKAIRQAIRFFSVLFDGLQRDLQRINKYVLGADLGWLTAVLQALEQAETALKNQLDTLSRIQTQVYEIMLATTAQQAAEAQQRNQQIWQGWMTFCNTHGLAAQHPLAAGLVAELYEKLWQAKPTRLEFAPMREQLNALVQTHKQARQTPQAKAKRAAQVRARNEELYVANAGLAIVAPYINYLFMSVGFMQDKQFVSREKQERAVLLLQYLCAPKVEIQEYHTTLAKVLCGLQPAEFIHTDFEPTAYEAQECESLLKIVIAKAEVFKNVSNDGFRGAFIWREAKLSAQGKNWLLQVEKQTHDILLEKIPWNYNLLKFPWAEYLIQLDW